MPGNGELRQHQAAGGDLPSERRILPPPAPFIWGLRRGGDEEEEEEVEKEEEATAGGCCLPSQEFGRSRRSPAPAEGEEGWEVGDDGRREPGDDGR